MKTVNTSFRRGEMDPRVERVIELCVDLARARAAHRMYGKRLPEVVDREGELREHFPSLTREELHRLVGVVVEAASLSLTQILGMRDIPRVVPAVERVVRVGGSVGVRTPGGVIPLSEAVEQVMTAGRWWSCPEIVEEFGSREWTVLTTDPRSANCVREYLKRRTTCRCRRRGKQVYFRRRR